LGNSNYKISFLRIHFQQNKWLTPADNLRVDCGVKKEFLRDNLRNSLDNVRGNLVTLAENKAHIHVVFVSVINTI
jgi:hypothetical protein